MDRRRIEVFRDFVLNLATLSKCSDKGVAALITNKEGTQVYSIGINGGPKHGTDCLCKLGGKYTCVHAEANALAKCTVADPEKVFICSYSTCVTCAALIVNSGASAVYYVKPYKDDTGLQILQSAGIVVKCIDKDFLAFEDTLDRLRLGHEVRLSPRAAAEAALFNKLQAYAEAHHIDASYTCLQCDDAGPKYVAVRWVNHNG